MPVAFEETNRFFLEDRLKQQLPGIPIVSANSVVRAQRMIKTSTELALMQAAAFLNNTGDTVFLINAGQTVQAVSYTSLQAKPGERILFVVL